MNKGRLAIQESRSSNPNAGLLVLLHGFGSNEADLFGLAKYFSPWFHVVSLRAPIPVPFGYAWFEIEYRPEGTKINAAAEIKSRQILHDEIGDLQKKYKVDPEQTFLYGFSQGAIMSYNLLLTQPQLIAGAVANNGRLLTEVWPERVVDERLAGKRLLILHTSQDPVIEVAKAHQARDQFSLTPVQLDYHEFEGEHTITEGALKTALAWLTQGR